MEARIEGVVEKVEALYLKEHPEQAIGKITTQLLQRPQQLGDASTLNSSPEPQ